MKHRQSGRIGAFGVIALVVVGVLAMLAAVYGPRLVREGRAVGVPLVKMARSEKALDALDTTYSFEPPADGRIPPDRLEAFLEIREDLKPRYAEIHGTLSSSRKGHRGVTVTIPSTEEQTPEREPR